MLQTMHTSVSALRAHEGKAGKASEPFRRTLLPVGWRFGMAVAALLAIPSLGFAASDGESDDVARIASQMSAEFMKGFRALDTDQDGQVGLGAMVRTLKSMGYGQPQPRRRGGAGAVDPFDAFESRDEDGDGVLRGDEIPGFIRRPEAPPTDGIGLEEFREEFASFQARRRGGGGRAGGRGGAVGRGQAGSGAASPRSPDLASSDVQFLAALDSNRDMELSTDEARDAIHSEVAEAMLAHEGLDTDADGLVSAREYGLSQPMRGDTADKDGLDGHARGHFSREDTDGDGLISTAEASERVLQRLLPRCRALQVGLRMIPADSNLDNKLDLAELQALSASEIWTQLEFASDKPLDIGSLYGKLYVAPLKVTEQIDKALSRE